MSDEIVKEKKTRSPKTPRQPAFITKGALGLSLSERVELVKTLKESIQAEVETIQEAAKQAAATTNGLWAEISWYNKG